MDLSELLSLAGPSSLRRLGRLLKIGDDLPVTELVDRVTAILPFCEIEGSGDCIGIPGAFSVAADLIPEIVISELLYESRWERHEPTRVITYVVNRTVEGLPISDARMLLSLLAIATAGEAEFNVPAQLGDPRFASVLHTEVFGLELAQLLIKLRFALENYDVCYDGRLKGDLHAALRSSASSRVHGITIGDTRLALHRRMSRAAKILKGNFAKIVVIDAASACEGEINFEHFMWTIAAGIIDVLGLYLDASSLHPEELTQLLKDESKILFCFLSVHLLLTADMQRLRGLGFTQTDHRVFFCGINEWLTERSIRGAPLAVFCDKEEGPPSSDTSIQAVNPSSQVSARGRLPMP